MKDKFKKDGGTIRDWQVHNLSLTMELIESVYPGENLKPQIVSGTVVHDSQGRWQSGHHMKTSLIVEIDRKNKILETRNTIYKLAGKEGTDIFKDLGDDIMNVIY